MSALIVTASLAAADFAWLEGLRRAHYPAERNRVPAHLTMFQALPPSALDEVKHQFVLHSTRPPPRATIHGVMDLGGGVAFRVVSEELEAMRQSIADHCHGLLSASDAAGWWPHITIQNKVSPKQARALIAELQADFRPRPLDIAGLSLHRYREGSWKALATYPFRG